MRKWIDLGLSVGVGLALVVAIAALLQAGTVYQEMGVSRYDSLHLDDSGGTATPVFMANQAGTGVIAEFRDAGTPVVRVPDGGGLDVIVGNVSSGTGAYTITDDLVVTGTLVVSGNVSSGTGAVTVSDDLTVTGVVTFADHVELITGEIWISGTREYTVSHYGLDLGGNVLTMTGTAFSGPIVYGTASNVVSGTVISHGVGTTPTVAFLQAYTTSIEAAPVFVLSPAGLTSSVITVAITPTVASMTVYWWVGK